jgi:hypothetical protein
LAGERLRGRDLENEEQNARPGGVGQRQKATEVQVARQDDALVGGGPGQDDLVRRCRITDVAPVDGSDTSLQEGLDPQRGEVHVDDSLHCRARSTSRSSTRHAAY